MKLTILETSKVVIGIPNYQSKCRNFESNRKRIVFIFFLNIINEDMLDMKQQNFCRLKFRKILKADHFREIQDWYHYVGLQVQSPNVLKLSNQSYL